MSYQVLARKWRPKIFKEMVGQEHVLKALINALDNNRLHHAYLFTGTRGVGKTSIARILAKCLNCEAGVTSEPCGQCGACEEISQGRFVDLIEVDAASRTKVEDTRELMDNVQYMPSKGRFKVYLIDEVHMLSGHSFNALLKTLEEPPPHVKFLLATTDPQKLPITVLSRCLQFNLKNLSPECIEQHLEHVLGEESIPFETSALWQLARSADGSMRDALSLTDQAISFGNGQVEEVDVSNMLGTIDQRQIVQITEALVANDAKQLLACVESMSEHIPDYSAALAELIVFLHRIAIAQTVPEAIDNTYGDQEQVLALAKQITAEDVQLFYQTALLGRRDLPLAPDPRCGFEMVLLRMLAFKPQGVPGSAIAVPVVAASTVQAAPVSTGHPSPVVSNDIEATQELTSAPEDSGKKPETLAPADSSQAALTEVEAEPELPSIIDRAPESPPVELYNTKVVEHQKAEPQKIESRQEEQSFVDGAELHKPTDVREKTSEVSRQPLSVENLQPEDWHTLVTQLDIGGVIQNTALNCQLMNCENNGFSFLLDQANSTLYDENHQLRLQDALTSYFGKNVTVAIQVGTVSAETPAVRVFRLKQERQAQALKSMREDPMVNELIENFGARLCEETVEPID